MVRVPMKDGALRALIVLALGACALAALSGVGASVSYVSTGLPWGERGPTLQHLRPLHESFAFAWVFLGGAAAVYAWMRGEFGASTVGERARMWAHNALWAAAGVGIAVTVLGGRFTGREYLGYPIAYAGMILAGWLLFAWNYFGRVGFRLSDRPAYVWMWWVAIPLFVITLLEAHLYLFEEISRRPVRDIAIQWKSYGPMVGSFNLLAYGALMALGCRMRGDDRYARSRTAFALLTVTLINTFTNYGHHTYHLPQSPVIHWVSFVSSMLEIVILAKLFLDLRRPAAAPVDDTPPAAASFLRSAAVWTFLMLLLAILISIPPLNAFIHGTHVVVAHSMGSMIGIDSMILWGALAAAIGALGGPAESSVRGGAIRAAPALISASLLVFWLAFLVRGAAAGWSRYAGPSAPDFSLVAAAFPKVMVVAGVLLAGAILSLCGGWGWAVVKGRRSPEVPSPGERDPALPRSDVAAPGTSPTARA